MKSRLFSIVLACILCGGGDAHAQTALKRWIDGYITGWGLDMTGIPEGAGAANYGSINYASIDLSAMTHVFMFCASLTATGTMTTQTEWDGSLTWGTTLLQQRRLPFTNYVHAHGKPIVLTIFGIGNGTGDWTTMVGSAAARTTAIKTIVDSVLTAGQYDGVDFDIEPFGAADTAGTRLFLAQLYDTLQTKRAVYDPTKHPILCAPVYTVPPFWASVASTMDQINVMTYDMFGGTWTTRAWHNNPPFTAGATDIYGTPLASVQGTAASWRSAGVPANKLGFGIDFNGHVWQGGLMNDGSGNGILHPLDTWLPSTPPTKPRSGEWRYYELWNNWIDTATTTLKYDSLRKVPYISIDNRGNANDTYITFQDTSTMRELVTLLDTMNVGGSILWEIAGGWVDGDTPHDRLLQAVKKTAASLGLLSVTPVPVLTASAYLLSFGSIPINTLSPSQSLSLSGTNLSPASGSINIAAPAGYQVSLSSGSGYASSVSLSYSGSAFSSTTVYIRFTPVAAQNYNGNLTITGGGASLSTTLRGIGVSLLQPVLSASPQSLPFGNIALNDSSAPVSYSLSGSGLTPAAGSVFVNAPPGFSVSLSPSGGYRTALAVAYSGGILSGTPVYVKFIPTAIRAFTGAVTDSGGGASISNVSVSGTGVSNAIPLLTAAPDSLAFAASPVNTPSGVRTYTLSGSNLKPANGNISVTAPNGFSVSRSNESGFGTSLTIPYTSGVLPATMVYVQFLPTEVRDYTDVVMNSGGSTSAPAIVHGTGIPLPTCIFDVYPRSIPPGGGRVMLRWSARNATAIRIDPGIGTVPLSDSITVFVTGTTTFTLTLTSGTQTLAYKTTVVLLPENNLLDQNYPNPFNATTDIRYSIITPGRAVLTVYNILGQRVTVLVDNILSPGQYTAQFDPTSLSLSSGVYLYRLESGGKSYTKRLLLLK